MAWQGVAGAGVDQEWAASAGAQAGAFLVSAIHAEVDGAAIDPVTVMTDPRSPDHAVYAVTAVSGPLRRYLATAWGKAGHVSGKQIVSYGTIEEARQAARDVLQQRASGHGSPRTYVVIGTFSDDAG